MSPHFGIVLVVFLASTSAVLAFKTALQFEEAFGNKEEGNYQFAVLFVTDGTDDFHPDPEKENYIGQPGISNMMMGDNYAARRIRKNKKVHTEVSVLAESKTLLKNFKSNPTNKPFWMLYTKNSPCCKTIAEDRCTDGCSLEIAKFASKSDLHLYLSWSQLYKNSYSMLPADSHFLIGLSTILSTNKVTLQGLPHENWLQVKMASCLIEKNAAEKLFTENDTGKQNIRKMVNKVVWELGTRAIQINNEKSWIRKESEWNKALSNGLSYTCGNLNVIVKSCLTANADAEVGPPVNPKDGKFSSSAEVLLGDDYEFQGIDKSKC